MKNLFLKSHIFLLSFCIEGVLAQQPQSHEIKSDSVNIGARKTNADQLLTGYRTQTQGQITGSVFFVQKDMLNLIPAGNILKQMQGIVPGLTVIGSGQPGELPKCYIRGLGSFSGSSPLFIVDGVPSDDISFLNSNDIESIAVLKDASAAAIYGGRALNGVMVINTKKAAPGLHIQFNTLAGVQFPGKGTANELLTAKELADLQWLVYKNDQRTEYNPLYGPSSNLAPVLPSWAANTDWYDAVTKPEVIQNHDLSVSAGSENSKIYLGASYFDQNGIILNTGTKRYTVRMNSEFSFFKKHLKIGENIQFAKRSGSYVDNLNNNSPILNGPYRSPSIIPVYITEPMNGLMHSFLPGEYGGTGMASRLGNSINVVADRIRNNDDIKNYQQLAGNAFTDLMIINGLNWRTSVGGTWKKTETTDYSYATYENSENNTTSSLTKANSELSSWLLTSILSFERSYGSHKITAMAGVEKIKSNFGNFESKTTDGVSGTGTILNHSGYYYVPLMLQSAFAVVDYSFNDKYFFSSSVRLDESKVFPAFSLGWRLSKEKLMNSIKWLNDFKLRGSYGRTGNMYAGWEYVNSGNLGFDSRLFNNHLGLSFDWFSRNTMDLYVNLDPPGTSGGGNVLHTNDAAMKNSGFETNLNFNSSIGALRFNANLNFSSYTNEIGEGGYSFFDQGNTRIGSIVRNQPGHPVSSFFGYRVTGLFNDQTEIAVAPAQQGAQPGFFRYADINGDKVIDPKDRTFLGNPNPKFTSGLNLELSYKRFDLGALLYLSEGNEIYNFTKWWTDFWPSFNGQKSKLLLYDSWTENNKNASVPKATNTSNFSTNTQNSSYYLEDGSFLRLRSLQFGYSFGERFLTKSRISSLRLYIQAVNLFTVTKYSGLDPEIGGSDSAFGIDNGNYPNVKQVIFGLKLGI